MCGIVGVVGSAGEPAERERTVRAMAATLVHRGPDGEAVRADERCGLGLRRLAIRDPEAEASLYCAAGGAAWSVTNGEIYNVDELRRRIDGAELSTRVDTELVPHLYERDGPGFVERLEGMFAIAVWDARERRLLLARDRTGEKPLFYWQGDGELAFASELRALLAHPRVGRALDPIALRRYLLHDYFPAPATPFASIRKLPAAHVLLWREGDVALRRYWDLADHFRPSTTVSRAEAAAELDHRIGEAVERRRQSDVPVGVFLSGGIDSSTVLAHLSEQVGPGVPVFSLGHADRSFDETGFARETARFYDAEFHELVLSREDLAEGLRRVGEGFDEPLGDASVIPTHLLALHARQTVKVVLSGEGADELLAGYPTYLGHRVAGWYGRLPGAVRNGLLSAAEKVFPVRMGNVGPDYLLRRFSAGVRLDPTERHHVWFGSLSPDRHAEILAPRVLEALRDDDPFASARRVLAGRDLPDELARHLYTDFCMYLQDDLLTKVDRATMLASLEARAPFLDRRLAEFVAGLPSRFKLRGLRTKDVLRRAERRRLPPAVLGRRKRGFNIPFSRWIFDGLGDELRRRFEPERVAARGLFRPEGLNRLLDEHLAGRADHRKPLFTLLALDLWCDRHLEAGRPVELATEPTVRAAATPVGA